ncbi:Clp protease N-terminal domain-containing protein [Rhodococcus opacus]|uniref:Clp protease N-terminal domain-containing protein n=1 Tax=Rhodococcus opacus TaxID=37919 RepID=UPI0035C6FD42
MGTDHLLLALLDNPASTGAHILTDLASLPISEMRQHLRRELAHRPTPGPAHRIPIRLSNDEYTRAHAAARTAGQNLETSGPRPHHRRPRTTRIAGSVRGEEQLHPDHEPRHHCRHRHERAHQRQGELPAGTPGNRHQPARHHHNRLARPAHPIRGRRRIRPERGERAVRIHPRLRNIPVVLPQQNHRQIAEEPQQQTRDDAQRNPQPFSRSHRRRSQLIGTTGIIRGQVRSSVGADAALSLIDAIPV